MGKLAQDLGGGLVVVHPDTRTSAESGQQEHTRPGPSFVKPGTGGKMIRHPNGIVVGPVAGEALRHALNRGAVIVGEEPVKLFNGPSVAAQQTEAASAYSETIEDSVKRTNVLR
jgi:hypothetical protein